MVITEINNKKGNENNWSADVGCLGTWLTVTNKELPRYPVIGDIIEVTPPKCVGYVDKDKL